MHALDSAGMVALLKNWKARLIRASESVFERVYTLQDYVAKKEFSLLNIITLQIKFSATQGKDVIFQSSTHPEESV